jgi:hypothetical protein
VYLFEIGRAGKTAQNHQASLIELPLLRLLLRQQGALQLARRPSECGFHV